MDKGKNQIWIFLISEAKLNCSVNHYITINKLPYAFTVILK